MKQLLFNVLVYFLALLKLPHRFFSEKNLPVGKPHMPGKAVTCCSAWKEIHTAITTCMN